MLSNRLDQFLRDEGGGYTIWGLTWFILYVGIGGLAVDMTDAFRNQSMLQATADSAALAGIASPLSDENEVDTWALAYAGFNMASSVHGDVLKATEVDIGTWNFTDKTFSIGGADPNAVRAITRRDATNANPLATNFLRIVGLETWNVNAEGIAAIGIDECANNGIIAGGALDVKTHIEFYDDICLIGHEKFWFRSNGTTFGEDVYIGAGCYEADKKCIGPGSQVMKNEDFLQAFGLVDGDGNYDDPTMPENALRVADYIDAVLSIAGYENFEAFETAIETIDPFVDYSGYKYLANDEGLTDGVGLIYGDEPLSALPDVLAQYTVYDLDCPQNGYNLPEGNYANVAIIADCPISFVTDGVYNITNSLIATTFSGGRASISGSAKVNLGTEGCGGGNEMYSLGDINFASDGQFANLRILADGDVHFAASSDSPNGTNIQATGDVFLASGSAATSQYGLCGDERPTGAQSLSIALVR